MQAVDTRGVEPMAHAQDLSQRLRDDPSPETDRREAYPGRRAETEAASSWRAEGDRMIGAASKLTQALVRRFPASN